MPERTFIVCAAVSEQDKDLLEGDMIPNAIRDRFMGTAVRIIECEPERRSDGAGQHGH